MRLHEQVAVITGAGRGLGQAIALASAREGASVVLVARSADELDETAWLVQELGGIALPVVTDVRDAAAVQDLAQQTYQRFGRVDILVNGAGVALRTPVQDLVEADWDSVMDTLVKGTYLVVRAFLPRFIERRHGVIVNLTAPLERIVVPGFAAYASAKYAVEGLTKVLAKELRPFGIDVNGLHPGGFADTRMIRFTLPELTTGLLSPEIIVEPFLALATQPLVGDGGQIIDARRWARQQKPG